MNTYLKTEKNKSMSKFSLAFFNRKVKIYKMSHSIKSQNIMTETSIDDEITVYKYIAEDDLLFQTHAISCDTQSYNIINIYEDNPGINHIGIVHYISGIFCKNKIPLLYSRRWYFCRTWSRIGLTDYILVKEIYYGI